MIKGTLVHGEGTLVHGAQIWRINERNRKRVESIEMVAMRDFPEEKELEMNY